MESENPKHPLKAHLAEGVQSTGRSEALTTLAVFAVVALISVWLAFLPAMQQFQNGDSIVPVLASCYHWTLFYWQQNRLGQLVPLLASPFKNLMTNLLLQSGLCAFISLSAFFLVFRYMSPKVWVLGGAVFAGLYLVLAKQGSVFTSLILQSHYAMSLALGFLGLILLSAETGRLWKSALGTLCVLLGTWVNVSLVFSLLPIAICRQFFGAVPASPKTWRSILWTRGTPAMAVPVACFGAVWLTSHFYPYRAATETISLKLVSYEALLQGAWAYHNAGTAWTVALGAAAVLGGATLIFKTGREKLRRSLAVLCALWAGAAVNFAVMGALQWVASNDYDGRYVTCSVFLFQAGIFAFFFMQMTAMWPQWSQRKLGLVSLAVMALAVPITWGAPSPKEVRATIDRNFGRATDEILANNCTHVIGGYWTVIPAVFHANLKLQECGSRQIVWAITDWCLPVKRRWRHTPPESWVLAHVISDNPEDLSVQMSFYDIVGFEKEKTLRTIEIYRIPSHRRA